MSNPLLGLKHQVRQTKLKQQTKPTGIVKDGTEVGIGMNMTETTTIGTKDGHGNDTMTNEIDHIYLT